MSTAGPDPKPPAGGDSLSVPAGAPAWITVELLSRTLRVWQPYYRQALTIDDALDMLLSVQRLGRLVSRSPSS